MKKLCIIGIVSIMIMSAVGCTYTKTDVQQGAVNQTSAISSNSNTTAGKEFTISTWERCTERSPYSGKIKVIKTTITF